MRIFIASHYNNLENKTELDLLNEIVAGTEHDIFNFVTFYTEPFSSPAIMMERSQQEISNSDIFLVDVSEKSTGRMIETGIAYTLGKKIIIIYKKNTFVKDTLLGVASFKIEYQEITDIKLPLTNYLLSLKQQ